MTWKKQEKGMEFYGFVTSIYNYNAQQNTINQLASNKSLEKSFSLFFEKTVFEYILIK